MAGQYCMIGRQTNRKETSMGIEFEVGYKGTGGSRNQKCIGVERDGRNEVWMG